MATRFSYDEGLFSPRGKSLRRQVQKEPQNKAADCVPAAESLLVGNPISSIIEEQLSGLRSSQRASRNSNPNSEVHEEIHSVAPANLQEALGAGNPDFKTRDIEELYLAEPYRFLKEFLALLPGETRLIAQALRAGYSLENIAQDKGRRLDDLRASFRLDVHATLLRMQTNLTS